MSARPRAGRGRTPSPRATARRATTSASPWPLTAISSSSAPIKMMTADRRPDRPTSTNGTPARAWSPSGRGCWRATAQRAMHSDPPSLLTANGSSSALSFTNTGARRWTAGRLTSSRRAVPLGWRPARSGTRSARRKTIRLGRGCVGRSLPRRRSRRRRHP